MVDDVDPDLLTTASSTEATWHKGSQMTTLRPHQHGNKCQEQLVIHPQSDSLAALVWLRAAAGPTPTWILHTM